MDHTPPADVTYYLIRGVRVGKKDGDHFLYAPGEGWVRDINNVIADKLAGYDPTEPAGSPYAMYNESIMDQIEQITEANALALIAKLDSDSA